MKPNRKATKITKAMRETVKAEREAAKAAKVAPAITENREADASFQGQEVHSMTTTEVVKVPEQAVKSVQVVIPIARAARKSRDNVTMISTADKGQLVAKSDSDWQFEVEQENLLTRSGKASGIWAVVRQDTGEVIGQYKGAKALPYSTLVNTFETGLVQSGFNFKRNIITTCGGARFFASYELAEINVRGEAFKSILRLQSSHNGSLSPGFCFEAERLRCLNGMMVLETVFSMFKKHSEKLDLGFLKDTVHKAIEAGQGHVAQFVESMAAIQIADSQARNIVSNIVAMGAKAGVSEKQGLFIYHNWRNPSADETELGNTLYRLYNAATRYTRDVANVGRFESSRKSNLFISGAFNLAAKQPDYNLAKLLATPAQPLDFDGITINV